MMSTPDPPRDPYAAVIEPLALLQAFLQHPPEGFTAERTALGTPTFLASYDLLTTLEDAPRRILQRLPMYRLWGRLLRWRTRFAGTTVTEYTPLPADVAPSDLVRELLERYGRGQRLLVVKDLACDSPLLSAADNAHVQGFVDAAVARGFVILDGMRLAWVPLDFESTDAFITRLSANARSSVRRKLKSRRNLQLEIIYCGDQRFASDAEVARYYALFRNVYDQSEVHFDLLTEEFFRSLLRDPGCGGLLFTYRLGGELIGWSLCYEYRGMLLDKYVGFVYPQSRENNLYFVCWFDKLEYALRRGHKHFVAGWTDSRVKSYLGARMLPTRHAVYVRSAVLRWCLRRVSHWFESEPGK